MARFLSPFRRLINSFRPALKKLGRWAGDYWRASRWHKAWIIIAVVYLLGVGTIYGLGQWYIHQQHGRQVKGVSFIADYASYLGVDPDQTLDAIIHDLGVKNLRLVSYWSDIEPAPGQYDFSQLDWQFKQVEAVHGTVTLSIGLRQPRWPECHPPAWVDDSQPESQWLPQLETFITKVVERYKNSPALVSYQLENEYFNNFGECHNFDRQRLVKEYKLVKKLDPKHPVILTKSNAVRNLLPQQPRPDEFGLSVYRRVWSPPIGRYFQYPLPPWYYAFEAEVNKLMTGRDSFVHELQAEPWPPGGKNILDSSLKEQNETLNAQILKQRFDFGRATGLPAVYYWGAEYWYYRWKIEGDKSVWNVARQEFHHHD